MGLLKSCFTYWVNRRLIVVYLQNWLRLLSISGTFVMALEPNTRKKQWVYGPGDCNKVPVGTFAVLKALQALPSFDFDFPSIRIGNTLIDL